KTPSYFSPDELNQWRFGLQQADDNNVFCHCQMCDREWIASSHDATCTCGSTKVERISCWQFPDG
ncbi:MAG: hypothetical protein AAGH78_16440, partial [Cyanobacteria bacterium P01_H01_bin.58]